MREVLAMAKRKDPIMNARLLEELYKLDGTHRDIARKIGCSRKTLETWMYEGNAPSAYHLKGIHEVGLDVIYILTGERHV
jgi:transcriptional regulator with XRE-family HTH domain